MNSDPRALLTVVRENAEVCSMCSLHETRTKTVFSRGSRYSPLMIVGGAPGVSEDQEGLPFVDEAGALLDRVIADELRIDPWDVYVTNSVKCARLDGKEPSVTELLACRPFLELQIELVAPVVILALGRAAAEAMGLPTETPWRGQWGRYEDVPTLVTFHPAYVLKKGAEAESAFRKDVAAIGEYAGRKLSVYHDAWHSR